MFNALQETLTVFGRYVSNAYNIVIFFIDSVDDYSFRLSKLLSLDLDVWRILRNDSFFACRCRRHHSSLVDNVKDIERIQVVYQIKV